MTYCKITNGSRKIKILENLETNENGRTAYQKPQVISKTGRKIYNNQCPLQKPERCQIYNILLILQGTRQRRKKPNPELVEGKTNGRPEEK